MGSKPGTTRPKAPQPKAYKAAGNAGVPLFIYIVNIKDRRVEEALPLEGKSYTEFKEELATAEELYADPKTYQIRCETFVDHRQTIAKQNAAATLDEVEATIDE